MDVGFTSEQSAQDELDRIFRQKEKIKDLYPDHVIQKCIENNIHIPSSIKGSDWKIEPIKLKPIQS
jgi:hypothetical protein